MPAPRLSLILSLLALPALASCGAPGPEPLSPQALAAVAPKPGIAREALARKIDALFTQDDIEQTRAVVVLWRGKVVAERYADGYGPLTRFVGWSMAKSVTAVMIGMLVSDGRLRLDDPAPVPAWRRPGDPRGEVTLRHLLQMRSGLRHSESAEPIYRGDTVRMLFLDGRDNMAAYSEAQPLEAEPGAKYEYSTPTSVILSDIAARALSDSPDPAVRRKLVGDYLRTRLFEPLGMRSAVPEFDAAGTLIGGSLIHATAADWGKFGEFLRTGGAIKGGQLVPRAWIGFMTSPSPPNPAYGAHVWLNRPREKGAAAQFAGLEKSIFAVVGHLGQYVMVAPERQLTIVRIGNTRDENRGPVRARMVDLAELFPRR